MALFESLTDDPRPYILAEQRAAMKEGVHLTPTVFHVAPMTAREFQLYSVRRAAAETEKQYLNDDVRSGNMSTIDEETLRAKLKKVENAFKDGDVIEDAEAIGDVVKALDFLQMHELIRAASNRSILRAGAKNS